MGDAPGREECWARRLNGGSVWTDLLFEESGGDLDFYSSLIILILLEGVEWLGKDGSLFFFFLVLLPDSSAYRLFTVPTLFLLFFIPPFISSPIDIHLPMSLPLNLLFTPLPSCMYPCPLFLFILIILPPSIQSIYFMYPPLIYPYFVLFI